VDLPLSLLEPPRRGEEFCRRFTAFFALSLSGSGNIVRLSLEGPLRAQCEEIKSFCYPKPGHQTAVVYKDVTADRSMMKSILNFLNAYSFVLLVGTIYAQYMLHFDAFRITEGHIAGSLGMLLGGGFGASAFGALCGLALELVKKRGKFEGTTFVVTSLLIMFVPWGFDLLAHFSNGNVQ
jgi:hypothetical protein